jgi:hypothetical protein
MAFNYVHSINRLHFVKVTQCIFCDEETDYLKY